MDQLIKDDKIEYIREDLAYNLIRCINLTVIADEFRKYLGIKNNQLVLIEREIIAIIMKIFAKEVMVRQYKIHGLPYEVDLCFIVHKLVIEIDEDGHVFYDVKEHQIWHKLIESLGFTFIRINYDVENPYIDNEISKIYGHINESNKMNYKMLYWSNFKRHTNEICPKKTNHDNKYQN